MLNTHWMKVSRTHGVFVRRVKEELAPSTWIEKRRINNSRSIYATCSNLRPFASNLAPIQDKPFRVRSVPESLEEAAQQSLETLRQKGVSEVDLMQALCYFDDPSHCSANSKFFCNI